MKQPLIRSKPARDPEQAAFLAGLVKIISDDKRSGRYTRFQTREAIERYCCDEHDYPVALAKKAMKIGWPGNGGDGGPLTEGEAQTVKTPQKLEKRPVRTVKDAGRKNLLFAWRNTFCAVRDTSLVTGLPATTRLVFWTMSRVMNTDGSGCHMGQERIAKDAGLTLRTVKQHLKLGIERGWLKRTRTYSTQYGVGYEYVPTIPHQQ